MSEKVAFSIALSRSVKLDDIELGAERAVSKAQSLDFTSGKDKDMDNGVTKGAESRAELASLYKLRYSPSPHLRSFVPFLKQY